MRNTRFLTTEEIVVGDNLKDIWEGIKNALEKISGFDYGPVDGYSSNSVIDTVLVWNGLEQPNEGDGKYLAPGSGKIIPLLSAGGDGNDELPGHDGIDMIIGGAGNDKLYGKAGDDILDGGTGDDYLEGGADDDVLTGGAGNDQLDDGDGNDRIEFGLGDGKDTLSHRDTYNTYTDTVVFGEGIGLADLSLVKTGNDLIINVGSNGDQLTLNYWFIDTVYQVDSFELADGTAYTTAELLSTRSVLSEDGTVMLEYRDNGTPRLSGGAGNSRLYGGTGSDQLYGHGGNDTLMGNTGNDQLYGGTGSDTYIFAQGDGTDTVYNYDTNAKSVDVARFNDASPEDLWFSRSGNNLQITVAGTDDSVTINNWYNNGNYQLDRIEVNSSVLINSQVEQLVSAMAAYNVPSGAGNIIPQDVKDELQPILAETWQIS